VASLSPSWPLGNILSIQGEKNKTGKRRTSAPARKRSTHVPFFSIFFSAFLGVSRQGEFENTRKKLSTFQKNSPGKYFFGGGGFFRVDFFDFFSFFCLNSVFKVLMGTN
jgi:hypothetical protein